MAPNLLVLVEGVISILSSAIVLLIVDGPSSIFKVPLIILFSWEPYLHRHLYFHIQILNFSSNHQFLQSLNYMYLIFRKLYDCFDNLIKKCTEIYFFI